MTTDVLIPCEYECGKAFAEGRSYSAHIHMNCPKRPNKPSAQTPERSRVSTELGLDHIPSNRATMAWYFRPPSPNHELISMTGLPEDLFYTADSWGAHHVDRQLRKRQEVSPGQWENHRLVCSIDRHEAMSNGTPVIAMLVPDADEDGQRNWDRILELMGACIEQELEYEREGARWANEDLKVGGLGEGQRRAARERGILLNRRIARLEQGVQGDALYDFFFRAAEASQAPLTSAQSRMEQTIGKIAEQTMEQLQPLSERV